MLKNRKAMQTLTKQTCYGIFKQEKLKKNQN